MRELSLHILDVIENAIRADASVISVTVSEKPKEDALEIVVEDNGPGFSAPPEQVLDPFYTTKKGKRTGLGLSLFQAAAEQAGGSLTIGKSPLGGAAVKAVMQLNHIDRQPMGDLAATLSSVVCTNPHLDLRCRIISSNGDYVVRTSDVAKELCVSDCCGLAVARRVSEQIKSRLASMHV